MKPRSKPGLRKAARSGRYGGTLQIRRAAVLVRGVVVAGRTGGSPEHPDQYSRLRLARLLALRFMCRLTAAAFLRLRSWVGFS